MLTIELLCVIINVDKNVICIILMWEELIMKKILAMLCVGVCAVGMTACGDDKQDKDDEQDYMTPIQNFISGLNAGNAYQVFDALWGDEYIELWEEYWGKEEAKEARMEMINSCEEGIEAWKEDISSEYGDNSKLKFKVASAEKFGEEELENELVQEEERRLISQAYHVYGALYIDDELFEDDVEFISLKADEMYYSWWLVGADSVIVDEYF